MRVVHISKATGIAGAETHLLWLLPALMARGVDVQMILLEDPAHSASAFVAALSKRGVGVETMRIHGHADPRLIGRLSGRLLALAPDLVHTHLIHADLYGLAAAARAGIRATVSSRHDNNPFRRNPFVRWINRRAMRKAARIVAISRALSRFVVDVEGADESSVVTIHYGMDAARSGTEPESSTRAALGVSDAAPLVGVVGRLIEQKGVDVLIDAFPAIAARHPSANLVVVGDGPGRERLERQVRQLKQSGRITFTGWVQPASAVMSACDVIVVPSRWEGFGLVVLEAMASARPVVASRVDALPEIVLHEQTGLLVSPGDPASLAAAINELLGRRDWATDLGQAGRRRLAECFSVAKMSEAMLTLYAQVIADTDREPAAAARV